MEATPEPGYHIAGISSSDAEVFHDGVNDQYYFFMPLKEVTIDVQFEETVSIGKEKSNHRKAVLYPVNNSGKYKLFLNNEYQGRVAFKLVSLAGETVFKASMYKSASEVKRKYNLAQLPSGVYKAVISMGTERLMYSVVVRK